MSDRRNERPYVEFAAGATIVDGRTAGDALYIVESGTVLVEPPGAPAYTAAAGEVVGETALLDGAVPLRASARTAVRALRVPIELLPAVLASDAGVAMHLLRQLARRAHPSPTHATEHVDATDAHSITPSPTARPGPNGATPGIRAPSTPVDADTRTGAFVLRHAEGRIALPAQGDWLVGRPDPATGAIPEVNLGPLDLARSLSRRHARMVLDGAGGVALREEPGVSNGTWVNGARLAAGQTATLRCGDKLRFGAIEVELDRE
ncbi:cyclic nucleotide-binding domain-containing protein [Chiayiivirga flava]|uniref:FHA domain-containing protein n=1 Tax=Chiayiivirga flava TaxID=659595 RepID=A0A7W8DA54_9GAMM|nr:cyclic nucleotide-binding domain-containing protein [Chiayiivirga flava]MBB5209580.1 hypothetical protein [Chiayiivirga flava]